MAVARIINIRELLNKKSFFLLGPRSTGKSTLITQQIMSDDALIIDLLDGNTYLSLSANPSILEAMVSAAENAQKIIVIDEVQKVPQILDQVHRLIEKKNRRFLLTGSSARKLRTGAANLLAGRAWQAELFPLVSAELANFDLDRMLQYGGLPQVYLGSDPEEELSAYVQTYLREEILAEGLTRNLPQFSRFLKVASLTNAQLINFAAVGNDAGVSASTVRSYFEILKDTLLGFLVEPWEASKKRKAIATAKFYFFDTGVTHTLAGTKFIDRNSDIYGRSFEHWIAMELRAYLSYRRIKDELRYWRSINGQEVDFLLDDRVAIEVKATAKISSRDLKGLTALQEERVFSKFYCVSHDPLAKNIAGIECLHWSEFIKKLWQEGI